MSNRMCLSWLGIAWLITLTGGMPVHGKPHASLQVYQGPPEGERWARVTDFRIARLRN